MKKIILPTYQNSDPYELFHCAVSEMEAASILFKKKQYQEFIERLQVSAYSFARALLCAKGRAAGNAETANDQVSSEISALIDQDEQVYRSIIDVINLTEENSETEQWVYNIDDVFKRYKAALVSGRKVLVNDLNYHEHLWNRIKCLLSSPVVKLSSYILLLLILLFAVSFVFYIKEGPTHSSNLVGQVFWKADRNSEFNLQKSQSFPVRESTQFSEYAVTFAEIDKVYLLRVDPVHEKHLAEIDIEWIRLISKEGNVLRELSNKDFEQWVCSNCVILRRDDKELFSMRVTNKDPFVTSSLIDQDNVKSLHIRMRIVSKKTFWQWMLGIDN